MPSKILMNERPCAPPPARSKRRSRWLAGIALASLVLLSACAGRKLAPEERPVASLASTQQAKDEFHSLDQLWLGGLREQRQSLDESLLAFRKRHPDDDLARLAAVYLAWNAIERDELDKARELAREVLAGPSGTTHDWAEITEAAILRREGEPAKALERLAPLVGKVIEPHARTRFSRELVASAIEAGRYYEAVGYMDVWLQQAFGEDRTAARRQVDRALAMIPLEVARSIVRAPAESGYSQELRRALASRLEAQADDSTVDYAFRDPANVDGRTVGLLLSLGSASQRAKGAEALSGILHALGLPRAHDAGVKLVTSDDGGDPTKTEAALAHLASRGAAIAIAGFDPVQAAAAARYSERTSMPIILLAAPEKDVTRPASAFLVAGGEDAVTAKLLEALSRRGSTSLAWVSSPLEEAPQEIAHRSACDDLASSREARFPLTAWRKAKIDGLLVSGSPACALDAVEVLDAAKLSAFAGIGLDAAANFAWAHDAKAKLLVAGAGRFPLVANDAASPLTAFVSRHGAPPSYLAALARDATVLAEAALADLPTTKAAEPGDVAWRYVETTRALESARGDLWTTEARGFGPEGDLAREIRIREIE